MPLGARRRKPPAGLSVRDEMGDRTGDVANVHAAEAQNDADLNAPVRLGGKGSLPRIVGLWHALTPPPRVSAGAQRTTDA